MEYVLHGADDDSGCYGTGRTYFYVDHVRLISTDFPDWKFS